MGKEETVLVINHHQANLKVKERTSPAGKVSQRSMITTEVHSEPIVFMLDEKLVAKRAAEMFAQRIREQTLGIVDTVKASTGEARDKAARAFSKGKAWAVRRYAGGRTGATPPRTGERRMFNHSGRLAHSIVARWVESTKEWAINYAANRWNPADFAPGKMAVAFQKWVDRVAVLQDPSADLGIQRAIRETFGDIVQKAGMDVGYKTAHERGKAIVERLRDAAPLVSDDSLTEEEVA